MEYERVPNRLPDWADWADWASPRGLDCQCALWARQTVIGGICDEGGAESSDYEVQERLKESPGRLAAGELRLDRRVLQTISKNDSVKRHDTTSGLDWEAGNGKRETGDQSGLTSGGRR